MRTAPRYPLARRAAALSVLAIMTGVLAIGCAATAPPGSTPESATGGPAAEFLDYAACMREAGITEFPDPGPDGLRLDGTGIDPESDEFTAADAACAATLPEALRTPGGTVAEGPADGWEDVQPGGDCACADGSGYRFWVRPGDPSKVLFVMQGGGACWSAELCDPDGATEYRRSAEGAPAAAGVFDPDDPDNPFADYSMVYLPYCTGDVFLGSAVRTYDDGDTVHHTGFLNGSAALDELKARFPDATDVVVAGLSAGSVAAPLYAGLVADLLPQAAVTVLSDGSGSYPDDPGLNALTAASWDVGPAIDALSRGTGSLEDWSTPGLFILAGRLHPDIVFARHDYAYDANQSGWYDAFELPVGDLLVRMDANERVIEAAGVNVRSYTAPGDAHTVLTHDELYTESVGGQPLVDWIADLVAGRPVDDVRCTECGT